MEKIESFYEKVNGSYFYFLGVAISMVSIVISIALYTAGGATYGILTNYISDLGAINAPNNTFIVFNTGLIINSIISPFGTLFLVLFFQNKDITQKWIIWLWFWVNIISTIGTFLVAIFPEDTMLQQHIFAALITFTFGMLSYLIYGFIALFAVKIAKHHSIPGFVLAAISFIFMASWVFLAESVIKFFEWMVLFGGWGFGIYLGMFSLKAQ